MKELRDRVHTLKGYKYFDGRGASQLDLFRQFVEGIHAAWKTSGDDEWMKEKLDAAVRAMDYSFSDPARFSANARSSSPPRSTGRSVPWRAYRHDPAKREVVLVLTGSGERAECHVMLPAGVAAAAAVTAGGSPLPFATSRLESTSYADFAVGLPGPAAVRIRY